LPDSTNAATTSAGDIGGGFLRAAIARCDDDTVELLQVEHPGPGHAHAPSIFHNDTNVTRLSLAAHPTPRKPGEQRYEAVGPRISPVPDWPAVSRSS